MEEGIFLPHPTHTRRRFKCDINSSRKFQMVAEKTGKCIVGRTRGSKGGLRAKGKVEEL